MLHPKRQDLTLIPDVTLEAGVGSILSSVLLIKKRKKVKNSGPKRLGKLVVLNLAIILVLVLVGIMLCHAESHHPI